MCQGLVDQFFTGKRIILCEGNKFIVRKGMRAVEFVVVKMDPAGPYRLVDTMKISRINYLTDVKRYKVIIFFVKKKKKKYNFNYE